MHNTYFKMIGQKAPNGKMILVAVVDEDFLGEDLPSIFEVQSFKMAPTIYTGTYPQIKVNSETIKDRTEELKGQGIAGILTSEMWYCKKQKDKNIFGINIP